VDGRLRRESTLVPPACGTWMFARAERSSLGNQSCTSFPEPMFPLHIVAALETKFQKAGSLQ
jgi:hypothetical protein